jgi:hypothetical protein
MSLSNDQQRYIGNDIEDYKDNFECPEERVYHHVVGFPSDGKPFAWYAIHKIWSEHEKNCPQHQDAAIYDGAPHEEHCECWHIHDVFLYPCCIQLLM